MPTPQSVVPGLVPAQTSLPPLTAVNLDIMPAQQLVHTLTQQKGRPPQLLVDCGALHALRTLGIGHVVAELLVLRQSKAQVWLRNVGPGLHQCLRLLRLDQLFRLAD